MCIICVCVCVCVCVYLGHASSHLTEEKGPKILLYINQRDFRTMRRVKTVRGRRPVKMKLTIAITHTLSGRLDARARAAICRRVTAVRETDPYRGPLSLPLAMRSQAQPSAKSEMRRVAPTAARHACIG